ncbi:MAG: CO dehydrogenase/acetyl-CoA synthase subunit delta [Candidatus Thermoplasmatota archaeon]|nr:CO dehydrogenase/acetyl-CoA synthase subunit delta [Candidatus Thermoplasmatota archaeon]
MSSKSRPSCNEAKAVSVKSDEKMAVEIPHEKWSGKIEEVALGATKEEGGTRAKKITVGGETTLPFLTFEGALPNKPVIAIEVHDTVPTYPDSLREIFEPVWDKPEQWAKVAVEKWHADLICLKLKGIAPDGLNKTPQEAFSTVEKVLKSVDVPLFIYGCGDEEKDAKVFNECGELIKKERCTIGLAENEKYKSLAAAAMGFNCNIVAFSNIDINLAKQLNILLTDFGVKKNRILMDPLQAGLGYGLEYSYSIIERLRLGALLGDAMLQMAIVCDSTVAWDAREAVDESYPGELATRGILWEATTAISALTAGADVIIMRHPRAVELVRNTIEKLTGKIGE